MSVKSSKSNKVAYMQEEDDLGNIRGDVTYAASAAPSPSKEQMNSRKKRRDASPSAPHHFTDSDSTVHPNRRDSRSSRSSRPRGDRDKSIPPTDRKALARPMSRHSKSTPVIETVPQRRRSRDLPEAAYYGANPVSVTTAPARPRSKTAAPRPNSAYYAAPSSRPPLSNQRYHTMHTHQPPPHSGMPPPSAFGPPPMQPPQWQPPPPHPPGYGMMGPPPLPMQLPPGPPPPMHHEAFQPPPPPPSAGGGMRGLHQRFGPSRPQTSIGHRPPPAVEYGHPDDYDQDDLSRGMRRLSMGYGHGIEDERPRPMLMRPMSARPMQSSPFAAPPPMLPPPSGPMPISRGQPFQPLSDEPFEPLDNSYNEYGGSMMHIPRTRRESIDPSLNEHRYYATEVARTTGSRRNSYYGEQSTSSGSALEDKIRLASSYQEKKSGGLTSGGMRLTEEMLYEASRRGGPKSRSTRSSGSRDESDWRQSATTRTTRSSNEEDMTIRVKGNAHFKFGDTEMHCQDGTEINIRNPPLSRRIGSGDRPVYPELEDRRGRYDRPALRSRAPSQSGSFYAPRPEESFEYGYGESPRYDSPFAPLPAHEQWYE
ncbi:hypothetical protein Sste5346_000356 [Sporothrix stenoceras]|uniref:Uncharacterized protein n=1 Tax=Sporothrix stenoceras TaxID=5173 RepID=A0ABR3ZS97_9PEZI